MPIRTGQQYLDAIKDGRNVYIDGERVEDVTTDPRLCGGAKTVAELYDLQHRPELTDKLTFESPTTGDRVALSFIEPKNVDDMTKRGEAMKIMMDHVYGMFGRSPDFLNTLVTALGSAHEAFNVEGSKISFGDNVRAFYEHARENDLSMTHVLVNPAVDRRKEVGEQDADIALKVVRETDEGFYVNGARMVGTLAQFADELVVMPSAVVPSTKNAEDYAIAFAIPVATDGIKLLSRPTVIPQNVGHFLDHPLSLRLDEGDAVCVFEDVFIPWERTFIYRNPEIANKVYPLTFAGNHSMHQTMTRSLAKSEFMCALGYNLAKSTNVDAFPNVQNMLCELMVFVETQKAMLFTGERNLIETPYGTVAPSIRTLNAMQLDYYEKFARMQEIIQIIGAGGLIGVPSYSELEGEAGEDVNKYYQTANNTSEERIRLFRLANDVSMSSWAGRQKLYERYYQGDPFRTRCRYYNAYPKEPLVNRIDEVMADLAKRAEDY